MIGGMEWILLLLVVVLLLFGAKKIPELARSLGKATGEFKRGQREVEREIRDAIEDSEDSKNKRESKVVKAAKALGIDTEGKTESQLKKEIAEQVG